MKTTHLILATIFAATSAIHAAMAEHRSPAPLPEFQTTEQLAKWREVKAKSATDWLFQVRNSEFYTGKPFIQETGTYAFKYRQYDPELSRWSTLDPSGFPDGANSSAYLAVPTTQFDWQGLQTINSFSDAWNYWKRENGSSSDAVQAGTSIVDSMTSSPGFLDLVYRIQTQRIHPQLVLVSTSSESGFLADGPYVGPVDVGFVDIIIGRSSVSYSDSSEWSALTDFHYNGSSWGRTLKATTAMAADLYDVWDFTTNPDDPWWMTLIEETIPGWIAGPGTPFIIDGLFNYSFDSYAWQLE